MDARDLMEHPDQVLTNFPQGMGREAEVVMTLVRSVTTQAGDAGETAPLVLAPVSMVGTAEPPTAIVIHFHPTWMRLEVSRAVAQMAVTED